MSFRFVLPRLDGPTTGGTVYNRGLIAALEHDGHRCTVRAQPVPTGRSPEPLRWVDSLFLAEFAQWSKLAPLGLLAHYLPSLVRVGHGMQAGDLTDVERSALGAARAIITPSPYLSETLQTLGVESSRIRCVEPGLHPAARPGTHGSSTPQLVLIANLTQGKGIVPFLHALGTGRRRLSATLRIIGSTTMDLDYAARCRNAAAPLGSAVQFLGSLPQVACLEQLACSNLLISASRMESYGIAVAEALACGVPVSARRGGNIENLVRTQAGGRVFSTMAALADDVHAFVADNAIRDARRAAALANRAHRSWRVAAQEFASVTASLGSG